MEQNVPLKPKKLGDLVGSLKSQSFGTYTGVYAERNVEELARLARSYVFEGADKFAPSMLKSMLIAHHFLSVIELSHWKGTSSSGLASYGITTI